MLKFLILFSAWAYLGLSGCYRGLEPESPPSAPPSSHAFEGQIQAFKYSLYPELHNLPDTFDWESPGFKALSQKVADFVREHPDAFKAYLTAKLKGLNQGKIDLSAFQEVPFQTLERPAVPFPLVFLLEPGAQMMGQLPIYLLQDPQLTSQALSHFYLRMGIGGLNVQAQPRNPEQWEILIDAYSRAFLFRYDLTSGLAHLEKLYQRRPV